MSKKKGMIVSGYFNPIHKGHIEYFNNAKALADAIPESRTVILPNCGHAIVNEAPNEMLDALVTLI